MSYNNTQQLSDAIKALEKRVDSLEGKQSPASSASASSVVAEAIAKAKAK